MIRFGPFELDPATETLRRGPKALRLQPQPFKLLAYLASRPGVLVTREELQHELWGGDTFVDFDQGLNFCIRQVRAVLGDSAESPTYIETVPRRGYRFLVADGPSPSVVASHSNPRWTRYRTGAEIAIAAVAIAAVLTVWWARASRIALGTPPLVRFEIDPPAGGAFGASGDDRASGGQAPFATLPEVSPDGRSVVYSAADAGGHVQLWLRRLDNPSPTPLVATDEAQFPFWSFDGAAIGFFTPRDLRVISVGDTHARVVCEVENGRGGTWSRGGIIAFGSAHDGLFSVPAGGGTPRPLTRVARDTQEIAHRWPAFLPDGRHLLYSSVSSRPGQSSLCLLRIDEARTDRLVSSSGRAMFVAPDRVLYTVESSRAVEPPGYPGRGAFVREATLVSRRLDIGRGTFVTDPAPIVEHVRFDANGELELSAFSASDRGVVAYREPDDLPATDLVWFDRHGQSLGTLVDHTYIPQPDIAPDGRHVVFEQADDRTATDVIWSIDVDTRARRRLTFDPGHTVTPLWSPDGSQVVYASTRDDLGRLFVTSVDTGAPPRSLQHDRSTLFPTSWSPDGRFLAVMHPAPEGISVALFDLTNGKTTLVAGQASNGSLSPDGRWIAYTGRDSVRSQVFVQPIPANGSKWQITSDGGGSPRWRGDGRELFFVSADRLMSVDLDTAGGVLHVGATHRLFDIHPPHGRVSPRNVYAVTRDGGRFLVDTVVRSGRSAPVTVVAGLAWP